MTPDRWRVLCETSDRVARYCHEQFLSLSSLTVETKGFADYVSHVDRTAEAIAVDMIKTACPDDAVIGEENGGNGGERCWIVDPVDGTANFLSGLPFWAVSIAFVEAGEPVLGAVALPALQSQFTGGRDRPLDVRGNLQKLPGPGAIAFGIGRNPIWSRDERTQLECLLETRGHHIVSLGSCAASLALVAAGRLSGYVERRVRLWDCAAGHALCRSAGIDSHISNRGPDGLVDIAASWAKIQPDHLLQT